MRRLLLPCDGAAPTCGLSAFRGSCFLLLPSKRGLNGQFSLKLKRLYKRLVSSTSVTFAGKLATCDCDSIFVRAPEGVNKETIAILYDALIEL